MMQFLAHVALVAGCGGEGTTGVTFTDPQAYSARLLLRRLCRTARGAATSAAGANLFAASERRGAQRDRRLQW